MSPLRKDSKTRKQEDFIQIKKDQGQEIKCRGKRGPRGSFFPCYLKSLPCFVLPSSSFFYFTLSTSSSFLPINPPINLSPLFYLPIPPFTPPPHLWSLVHLWPWHQPQETLQLCLGLQRLSFTALLLCLFHTVSVCVWFGIMDCIWVHKHWHVHTFLSLWTGSRAFLCVFLLSQATQLEKAHL